MPMSKQLFRVSDDGQSQRSGSTHCSLEQDVSARSGMAICSVCCYGCDCVAILSTGLEKVSLEKYFNQ